MFVINILINFDLMFSNIYIYIYIYILYTHNIYFSFYNIYNIYYIWLHKVATTVLTRLSCVR